MTRLSSFFHDYCPSLVAAGLLNKRLTLSCDRTTPFLATTLSSECTHPSSAKHHKSLAKKKNGSFAYENDTYITIYRWEVLVSKSLGWAKSKMLISLHQTFHTLTSVSDLRAKDHHHHLFWCCLCLPIICCVQVLVTGW